MTRKNCIHNLRDNCIVITHNSSKEASACTKFRHQVIAQFVLHLPDSQTFFRKWTMPQLPHCARKTHDRKPPMKNKLWLDYTPARKESRTRRLQTWPLPPAFCRTLTVRRKLGRIVSKQEMMAPTRSASDFIPSSVCLKSGSKGRDPAR